MPLTLQVLTEADLDYITQSENHPDNRRFVGQWTHEQYRQALTNADYRCFLFSVDGLPVGHCILANLQDPDDAIQLKRIVVTTKGKGYGRASLTEIIRYVFETLAANRLWLDVRSFNSRAETLYRSVGFVYEGTQRKASKIDDVYYDLNLYGMLRSETMPEHQEENLEM
ncbi:GNAT family N-acetyltransferase [Spirosoma utsteinense]|uniref:RimJ/RimL family protein N-acetyltransferase n=1 Tax=Spirosoma utsteinense TaxID=2585773 RepID=A0ABR6W2F9_9BACT|nr:GNAT family protein [Spirosoma utsteinense]MBC3785153.1 RimJ/RimL family protein N-acetyltransferase [Spirosoma utsteinense]MBC3790622.1 RimJ/RimL family protein N-acetyltransferase [Spirosoma utsteinense]